MLILINANAKGLGAENGILKADDVQTLMSAREANAELTRRAEAALSEAKRNARHTLWHAEKQAKAMLEEARASIEAERRRGYEEGLRQAVLEWHERQARNAVKTSKSLGALHQKLAEIVTTAVERIVNTESRGALYERALKNVQSLTRGASSLMLRVSPADYEHARASIASLGDTQGTGMPVNVAVDPSLKGGSCIFESELGVLDASLETQLDGLRTAMARAVRAAVNRADAAAPNDADAEEEAADEAAEPPHPEMARVDEHVPEAPDPVHAVLEDVHQETHPAQAQEAHDDAGDAYSYDSLSEDPTP